MKQRRGRALGPASAVAALALAGVLAAPVAARADNYLFGIQRFGTHRLFVLDPADGSVTASRPITQASVESLCTSNGLAVSPTTETMYGIFWADGCPQAGRDLVTINPVTAAATAVGNTGQMIAAITFDSGGTLYGVSGKNVSTGGSAFTLFEINTGTGAVTQKCKLTQTDRFGVALASGGTNLLYHAYYDDTAGQNRTKIDTIDTADFPVNVNDQCPRTTTDVSNTDFGGTFLNWEPTSLVTDYSGVTGTDLLFESFGAFFSIELASDGSSASADFLGFSDFFFKGLAFKDVTLPFGDLEFSKLAARRRVTGTRFIDYTIQITNSSAVDATDVVIQDTLPSTAEVTYVSDDAGCDRNGTILTCDLGTIGNGQTRTVTITVQVICKGNGCPSSLSNTVRLISWDGFYDTNINNDRSGVLVSTKNPWK